MQVEITKMVYQHPWYVSSAPLYSNGWLGGLFISPTEKVVVRNETTFLLLTGHCCHPDRTRPVVPTVEASALIGLGAESGHCRSDASGRADAALEPLWT